MMRAFIITAALVCLALFALDAYRARGCQPVWTTTIPKECTK